MPDVPQNPITLLEYAGSMDPGRQRVFIETFAKESDLLRAIPFRSVEQGKDVFFKTDALPTVAMRAFNEDGNSSSGKTSKTEEGVYLMDEYVEVDRAMIDIYGDGHVDKQIDLKTIAMSQNCTRVIIKGDNSADPREPDGLQRRLTTTGTTLFHNSASSGGAALSLTKLDQAIAEVNRPTHLLVPRKMMYLWDGAARSPTLTNNMISQGMDSDLGRVVSKYKGLTILTGYEPDDTPELLDFNEVGSGGGSAVTASIYILSLGDERIHLIESTPIQINSEGQVPGKPFKTWHIKWDWGITFRHPRSGARLTSITNAAIVA
jgi:hypothetical protein